MLSIQQTQFITQYKRTLSMIQSLGGKTVIMVLVIALTTYLIQTRKHIPTNIEIAQQQTQINIIKKYMEKYSQRINIPETIVRIHNGTITTDGKNTLQSIENLITYKGFILPKNSTILSTNSFNTKQYFENTGYTIDDIRLQTIALINGSTKDKIQNNIPTLQIPDNDLYKLFSLDCINQDIKSPLCRQYIRIFLENFYVFSLDNNTDIINIGQKLRKDGDKNKFCLSLLDNAQYTNTFSDNIKNTVKTCDKPIQERYSLLENFNRINNEFNNNTYQNTIYNDRDLNTYKLVSFMQYIFSDIQSDNINIRRMEGYISYMQNLMSKTDLDDIYRDMSYRFVNQYLVPYLQQNSSINQKYPGFINQLLTLNKESILFQHSGLQNLVYNTNLIQAIQNSAQVQNNQSMESLIQGLVMLPYLTITKQTRDLDTLYIQGYLAITDPIQGTTTVDFTSTLVAQNNRLLVLDIQLSKYTLFSTVLKSFIKTRPSTLPALYSYINENIALYTTQSDGEVCEQLRDINTFKINICNASVIQGTLEQYNTDNIEYKITLEGSKIQSIQTSNDILTAYLNEKYKGTISDPIRLPGLIKEVLLSQIQEQTKPTQNEDSNIIRIAEKFETFFKVKPSDIVLFQKTYYIEFTINSITFILAYNEQDNISGPMYFRDVFINQIPLHLNNRSVKLDAENTQIINTFIRDPLRYIQENDPFIYESYQQFKGQ